jgi:hypothetical protein
MATKNDFARFDALTRGIALRHPRRRLLQLAGSALLGSLLTASSTSSSDESDTGPSTTSDAGASTRPTSLGASGRGPHCPCRLPSDGGNCVKLGGGQRPESYFAWFCPTTDCDSGFCVGRSLGSEGVCGATAEEIRRNLQERRVVVLEGQVP